MIIIEEWDWSGTRTALESANAEHRAALEAHKTTVGQPAPLAPSPLIEDLVASGEDFKLASELRAWAVMPNAPGDYVSVREIRVGDARFEGEMLVEDADPSGMIMDSAGTIRTETPAEQLARSKRARRATINAKRDEAASATVAYFGRDWDAGVLDRLNVAEAVISWQAVRSLPPAARADRPEPVAETLSWRDADNHDVELTFEQLAGLAAAMAATKRAAHLKARAIKDGAIDGAGSVAAVAQVEWT